MRRAIFAQMSFSLIRTVGRSENPVDAGQVVIQCFLNFKGFEYAATPDSDI